MTSTPMLRLVALAAAALALAACSGVPTSSAPEVVSPVRLPAPSAQATISPTPGADPQTIVTQFLSANASTDARHSAARAFLTPDAQRRWSDATVTVVADGTKLNSTGNTITFSANRIGTIDEDGVYAPDLVGNGAGGDPLSVQFALRVVAGQWRIDQLPTGLVVTQSEFTALYRQEKIYFLDQGEARVVPDLRYSALAQPADLASWLLGQLAAGPRPYLQNAVQDDMPEQADPRRVSAAVSGSTITVEVPGAGQLDARTLTLLAAQLTTTLDQAVVGSALVVTDGGRRVSVPQYPQGVTAADFTAFLPLSEAPPTALYFVRGQTLNTLAGDRPQVVPGVLGRAVPGLSSVALAYRGNDTAAVAATLGPPAAQRLMVGRLTDAALVDSGVAPGTLSRPAWPAGAPQPEVWVADGASVLRVLMGVAGAGRPSVTPVSLTARTGSVTGVVSAVAFSVDGARVALVLGSPASAPGHSQVWVGSVVRSGSQARVDGLQPVTPPDVSVSDVAWNDPTTLFVTGTDAATGDFGIWDVQSDGSLWKARDTTGLPSPPAVITAALEAFPVVQADGRLWEQRRSTWTPLYTGGVGATGTEPTYLQ